jgi:two-component system sensor histidine kinase EvgS
LLAVLLTLFSLSSLSQMAYADEEQQTIRVGVYDNRPKIYRDDEGNMQGFWADITDYIAEQENWNLIYVHGTWDECLDRLEKGQIDLMVDMAVSDERMEKYVFTEENALLSWGIFYTRNGIDLTSFADLEGKRIAIMTSGIHYSGPFGLKSILESSSINATIVDVMVRRT